METGQLNVKIDSKEILKARGLPRDGENRWMSRRDRIGILLAALSGKRLESDFVHSVAQHTIMPMLHNPSVPSSLFPESPS